MNIYLYEMKAYRKSTIIWSIGLVALVGLFFFMFPSIAKDADEYKKLLEGYPESVRKAMGIEIENLFSILGYYSYSFMYISLFGAIQAMNMGTSILSKEVREKTADFLLTKPVKRTSIVSAKLLAALTSLITTNIIYLFFSNMMAGLVANEDFSSKVFFFISLSLLFIQLIFLALGFFISVIVRKIKSVITVSLSFVFGFFLIGLISSANGDDFKRFLTPFKYFDTGYIIKHSSYEIPFLLTGSFITVILMILSYIIYLKKDVHTV
jgi:ABC-2 type transport system permease protein